MFSYLGVAGASLLMVLRMYVHSPSLSFRRPDLPHCERLYVTMGCRIAIWNRNRIAVAIAICAWNTNVAFQVHSTMTFSQNYLFKESEISLVRVFYVDIARVSILVYHPGVSGFVDSSLVAASLCMGAGTKHLCGAKY